jgi:predicted small metal-binding protein
LADGWMFWLPWKRLCECRYVARAVTDDEVLAKIREQTRTDHPDLLKKISDDDIRSWVEAVG